MCLKLKISPEIHKKKISFNFKSKKPSKKSTKRKSKVILKKIQISKHKEAQLIIKKIHQI